jgi:hypothetical protein
MESITVVKLLSCFDDLVAAGTASGRVAVFQLVSSLPGRNKQVSAQVLCLSSCQFLQCLVAPAFDPALQRQRSEDLCKVSVVGSPLLSDIVLFMIG